MSLLMKLQPFKNWVLKIGNAMAINSAGGGLENEGEGV